jgi:hypothetical protein
MYLARLRVECEPHDFARVVDGEGEQQVQRGRLGDELVQVSGCATEDCHWSANRTFMLCSFNNDWAGTIVNSVVVDTYNRKDKSYWHCEIFDGGDSGARPFISRMTIDGSTRIEYAESVDHGEKKQNPGRLRVRLAQARQYENRNLARWRQVGDRR